jgi:capsule synthesis protein PGA_cap
MQRTWPFLKAAGIDTVSLANNHTLDFGCDAMSDMLRLLDDAGIAHASAGSNLVNAADPAILEVNGLLSDCDRRVRRAIGLRFRSQTDRRENDGIMQPEYGRFPRS